MREGKKEGGGGCGERGVCVHSRHTCNVQGFI